MSVHNIQYQWKALLNTWHFNNATRIPMLDSEPPFKIINSTTGKYCSIAFICMVTLHNFLYRLKSQDHLVQHNKQHHGKALLKNLSIEWPNFRISSTESKVRTTFYNIINSPTGKYSVPLSTFHLNGHTLGFHPDSKMSFESVTPGSMNLVWATKQTKQHGFVQNTSVYNVNSMLHPLPLGSLVQPMK